jgi:hypothetical protein
MKLLLNKKASLIGEALCMIHECYNYIIDQAYIVRPPGPAMRAGVGDTNYVSVSFS